ncbi:thioredoxin domain-containing protein [uncultured Methanolobus sp.]|uniref:thioredoxin family protein n=1 Tax=uncultured Methanolobus sp. TaxID=218300 RepID=UPI002AAC181B|nr:thioredoxin domain-containing protein [uncultured Methanolobus sp.]
MSKVELLDFSATWCGPCKMQKPHLEKVEAELAGQIEVKVVDVDPEPEPCSTIWYSGSTNTYYS